MIKWEYMIVSNATQDTMQSLGEQGWEMCGIKNDLTNGTPYNTGAHFYFKRPIPPTKEELGEPRFNW
jgi:hypothetical protein